MAFKPARVSRRNPPPLADRSRCKWAADGGLLAAYHDEEWGRPIRSDAGHLERMALEIFQCGLSWKIVLVKRPALRVAFRNFNPPVVAAMNGRDAARLMKDAAIIRNRKKIEATIKNAARVVELAEKHGTFLRWLEAVECRTPAQRRAAFKLFKDLFSFMGPETTKCYLWGVGKVTPPHERACWMHAAR